MLNPEEHMGSAVRRALDEQIAAETLLSPLDLPAAAPFSSVESYLGQHRRPLALAGVVEKGLIRPLDPTVKLLEHSRVIIVKTEGT
jgi:hypothetical protein